jgi:hypothetical protein
VAVAAVEQESVRVLNEVCEYALTWIEEKATSDRAHDRLRQEDLVVLVRNGDHHQAKDV